MFLSRIEVNLGNHRARQDFSDPYEMHSTLSRALLHPDRLDARPARFLWRAERVRGGEVPVVLLQSSVVPRWENVEERSPGWARAAEVVRFEPERLASGGAVLRFRLRANPTVTRDGKRHALLRGEDQNAWLVRQGDRLGFRVEAADISDGSWIIVRKRVAGGPQITVQSVLWDGVLSVTHEERFVEAIRMGVGHARFLGLGLLSVAASRA